MRHISMPYLLAILTSFSLFSSNLLAQNPARGVKFEQIGLEQGLSQVTVLCIEQDHQGFMWFGTQHGLNKYDGYNFTIYKHDALDSNSVSDNFVTSICEDHTGTLWVGTRGGGVNRFDRSTEQFTRFINDPQNPNSLSGNRIGKIYEDRYDTLWIVTTRGLNRFDDEQEQFTRFLNNPENPNNNWIQAICEDSTAPNILWIGTANGLFKFDRRQEQFTRPVPDPQNPLSNRLKITSRVSGSNGIIPLGASGMLFDGQGFHLILVNFDTFGIFVFNQSRLHFQSRSGCGFTNTI